MAPLPYPVIDVTSRRQTVEELSVPLEDRRRMARSGGELWAVIVLTTMSPFTGSSAECVTAIVLNSTDDNRVNEFVELAKEQSPAKAARVIEAIGSEADVAMQAHRIGLAGGPEVSEVTVRLVDRIARRLDANRVRG